MKYVMLLTVLLAVDQSKASVVSLRCPGRKIRIGNHCYWPSELDYAVESDEIIKDYYSRPRTRPPPPCVCVPFYQCRHQDQDFTIRTCGETEVCCARSAPAEQECGWGGGGAGEGEARPGEFPWMLAILKVSAGLNWSRTDYVGGAALIHARVALTVAHKVHGRAAGTLKCRAGQWSRSEPGSQVQDRNVAKILEHPKYERKYTANDVALLRLSEPLATTAAVRPLCVARGPPPRPDLCYTMGWGQRDANSDYVDKLKKVQVSLVPHALCQNALQAVEYKRQVARGAESPVLRLQLHSTLACAGGAAGRDACAGDGGSPLVCQIEQVNASRVRYAGWGAAAWGVGCGEGGAPGVYADVAKLHDWIIENLKTIV